MAGRAGPRPVGRLHRPGGAPRRGRTGHRPPPGLPRPARRAAPGLRARIVQEGGAPRQRFDLPARIPLERRDLADGEAGLAAALREEAARVFSLARPPHVRAVLLSTGPQARVLVLSLHHAFCDGWSLEVLLRELFEAYGAPGAPALPAGPAAQHLDYARWEHSAPAGRAR
ncbi:condensation domain-containing protein, partial [Kitasatospora albolonga]|uniref:condensation domain-containing protein n=1 Tax=Kitasatospora albolonga TaxID=68173 RepID=UPI0031E67697